jgi:hypothetical protein
MASQAQEDVSPRDVGKDLHSSSIAALQPQQSTVTTSTCMDIYVQMQKFTVSNVQMPFHTLDLSHEPTKVMSSGASEPFVFVLMLLEIRRGRHPAGTHFVSVRPVPRQWLLAAVGQHDR